MIFFDIQTLEKRLTVHYCTCIFLPPCVLPGTHDLGIVSTTDLQLSYEAGHKKIKA